MRLEHTTYEMALNKYKEYYKDFKYGIDGYYERRILNSQHYLLIDDIEVGIVSINEDQLTGFYVFDQNNLLYMEYLSFVLDLEGVKRVLFSTVDKRLHDTLIELNYDFEYQAYNFNYKMESNTDFIMETAQLEHIPFINSNLSDFIEQSIGVDLEDFRAKITQNEVFIGKDIEGNLVSMGIVEPMILNPKRYCLGMIVLEQYRRQGYGVKTLQYLIHHLQTNELEINARCWYYNEASKKTLIKTGFEVSNLLLRIENLNN